MALPPINAVIDEPRPARRPVRPVLRHVHWFRWTGEDAFSGSSLYTCRCGQVRPSL